MDILIAVVAVCVGFLYLLVALYFVPRFARLTERSHRVARGAKWGAAALFFGCSLTNWAIAAHMLEAGDDAADHALTYLPPLLAQLVGGGLFTVAVRTTLEVRILTREEVRLHSEAAGLRAEAERNHRLAGLGQLAGGIAHDFNNILAVISTYATAAAEQLSDRPKLQSQLEEVVSAARGGSELTQQLMSFSQGRRPVPVAVEVDPYIRGILPMLETAVGHPVVLTPQLGAPGRTVTVGRGDLGQALLNLVLNARDAMPDGGTVRICTEAIPSATTARVRISVTDEGSGMDPEVAARAFEPFYTTHALQHGTGLGLSVVHEMITRAGGTVGIDTAPGQGTRVAFELPAEMR